MENRETFLQIQLRLLQHLIRRNWIHGVLFVGSNSLINGGEEWESNTSSRSEVPVRTVSQTFSYPLWEGDFSKNYGADQQRLHFSDLHFDKFPTPATFACWKIRFKTKVCTCSQLPTAAMLWIKEVEMDESVADLKSSSSARGIQMLNLEVFDAKIASTLNKIIHNSHFKRRISLEEQKAQKEDRFLRGRQIAYLIYEQFRVIGTDSSVETYTDLFTIAPSKWWYSGIRFEVGWNFIINDKDSIWRYLGRIVQIKNTRVWKTRDLIGIVWPGDSLEKSSEPIPYWKYKQTENGIEFLLYLVAMARFLVVRLKFRKSRRRQAKACDRTGQPVVYRTLAKTSEDGFQEFNSFCYRWIVYSWRRSTVTDESVKTTPHITRYRDVKVCKNLVTDEIVDHRIQSDYKCTIWLQYPEN